MFFKRLRLLVCVLFLCSFFFKKTNKDVIVKMQKMGESKGYGKVGGGVITNVMSANSYNVSLKLSPVVSFWDCIVRTMRYSYIPEWV